MSKIREDMTMSIRGLMWFLYKIDKDMRKIKDFSHISVEDRQTF
jgi:hypothetical protein